MHQDGSRDDRRLAASTEADLARFEQERARLSRLAYRMLGSVSEAEDAVQDAWLRWQRRRQQPDDARAYLTRITTRLCLDRLKRASRRREVYIGPWLPEPLVAEADGPEADAERSDDVSIALMLALERLSPLERAAFILRTAFDMDFAEIATALGREEAACRQLVHRARGHVRAARPRFAVAAGAGERLADAFFTAARSGDPAGLRDLLAAEVTLHTDGGGRKIAALNVIQGAERIARFFAGLAAKGRLGTPVWSHRLCINGLPGCVTVEADGTLQTIALQVVERHIAAIYVTRNPEKLRHLAGLVPAALRGDLQPLPPTPAPAAPPPVSAASR